MNTNDEMNEKNSGFTPAEQNPRPPMMPPPMRAGVMTNVVPSAEPRNEEPLSENPGMRELFEALLRRPRDLAALFENAPVGGMLGKLLGIAGLSLLVFGFVLGCFSRHEQLWAAPVKVLGGMMFAALICYPSLYVFSTLAGARISPKAVVLGLAGAMALAGMLLLGLAPALWIFVESTRSFGFIGMLAVAAWLVAMFFALRFIKSCAAAAGSFHRGPVTVWSILFLIVTLQLSTTLRPILGRSDRFLQLDEKRFFLEHWGMTMGERVEIPEDVSSGVSTQENKNNRSDYEGR